jgi:hypothetical protein
MVWNQLYISKCGRFDKFDDKQRKLNIAAPSDIAMLNQTFSSSQIMPFL